MQKMHFWSLQIRSIRSIWSIIDFCKHRSNCILNVSIGFSSRNWFEWYTGIDQVCITFGKEVIWVYFKKLWSDKIYIKRITWKTQCSFLTTFRKLANGNLKDFLRDESYMDGQRRDFFVFKKENHFLKLFYQVIMPQSKKIQKFPFLMC